MEFVGGLVVVECFSCRCFCAGLHAGTVSFNWLSGGVAWGLNLSMMVMYYQFSIMKIGSWAPFSLKKKVSVNSDRELMDFTAYVTTVP